MKKSVINLKSILELMVPFPSSIAFFASTFFSAIPSLIALSKSDLTSSWGFLTIGGAFLSCGGEVIVDIFFGGELEFGREPFTLIVPLSIGGGGGGGGGGIGAAGGAELGTGGADIGAGGGEGEGAG